jgi:hypothetical protein
VFDLRAAPKAKLLEYLFKSNPLPDLAKSLSCSSAETLLSH